MANGVVTNGALGKLFCIHVFLYLFKNVLKVMMKVQFTVQIKTFLKLYLFNRVINKVQWRVGCFLHFAKKPSCACLWGSGLKSFPLICPSIYFA